MTFRILSSADKSACYELLESTYSYRITPPPVLLALSNYYLNDHTNLLSVFGKFDESGKLSACIFVTFSDDSRSWTMDYIMKQPDVNLVSIVDLIDHVISYAEKLQYHTWYAVYFDNHDKRCEKFIQSRSTIFSRYTIYTETVIPNNKKSSFNRYWGRFQKFTMHDRRMIVKQYSLKEIHRTIT